VDFRGLKEKTDNNVFVEWKKKIISSVSNSRQKLCDTGF
jgi:hypothetical protein